MATKQHHLFTQTSDPQDPRKEKRVWRLSKAEDKFLKDIAEARGIHVTTLLKECVRKGLKAEIAAAENT